MLASLRTIAQKRKHLAFNLLAGSRTDYRRATQGWWQNVMSGEYQQYYEKNYAHKSKS